VCDDRFVSIVGVSQTDEKLKVQPTNETMCGGGGGGGGVCDRDFVFNPVLFILFFALNVVVSHFLH
jgi:hypothetical protein